VRAPWAVSSLTVPLFLLFPEFRDSFLEAAPRAPKLNARPITDAYDLLITERGMRDFPLTEARCVI
jgi:hypothetical protein